MNKLSVKSYESWPALLTTTALSAFFLVTMEWLFFVTQPSFISVFPQRERFAMWVIGAAAVGILALLPVLAAALLGGAGVARNRYTRLLYALAHVPAALILGAAFFLLLDNFTHTLFAYGVRDSAGVMRWIYLLVWLALIWFGFLLAWRWTASQGRRQYWLIGVVAVVLTAGVVLRLVMFDTAAAPELNAKPGSSSRPNVLIIGSDGVNAAHLSVYGYARETTPFLEQLARHGTVFENAYSNAARTGASITSLLTGKLPTETKVIHPPDVLQGEDAYQSLPALLNALGYRTFQSSVRHYADAYDLNFRGAFDYANGRSLEDRGAMAWLESLAGNSTALLLGQSLERIKARLLHVTDLRDMENAYALVTGKASARLGSDQERIEDFLQFIEAGAPPFFAHIHLLGTHGAKFHVERRVFSKGQKQTALWMVNFYDDAILQFDRLLRDLVRELKARGVYRNTLLIIYSDHGTQFATDVRIPLIVHTPGRQSSETVARNVQLLDVPATVLDVLGIEPPGWMSGQTLLSGDADNCEPIFSTEVNVNISVNKGGFYMTVPEPPLYSLGELRMVVCDRYYALNLIDGSLQTSRIEGSSAKCGACRLPGEQEARRMLWGHLEEHGYDVRAIRD